MINEGVRHYLLEGLSATPAVLSHMMSSAPKSVWDKRPDPERYTLREVAAHLADWEGVWFERLDKVRTQEMPTLQGYNPDDFLKKNNYAQIEVGTSLKRFQEGRAKILKMLENLEISQWSRKGNHTERGLLTMQDLAVIIVGHDSYHLRQVAEWIEKTKK
ncbi:DinB family protein [Candidatus Acetothermia bacterium]|nr:DinB family protein [Candidatus Acetothermia bacterium]